MKGDHAKGNLLGIVAGLLISSDALLIRLMQIDDGWLLIALRGALMWIVLVALYACVPRLRGTLGRPWLTRDNALAALSYAASAITFVQALLIGPVAMVLVIIASTPFMAALFAWMIYRERAQWPMLVAAAIGLLGVAIVVLSGSEGNSMRADLYALGTAVSMGLALVFSGRVRSGTVGLPSLGGMIGSIFVTATQPALLSEVHTIGASNGWIALVAEGAIVMPLAMGLLSMSTRFVPAAAVGLFLLLETALGPLWIWMAFGEAPGIAAIVGGTLIIGAVVGHFIYDVQHNARSGARDPVEAC